MVRVRERMLPVIGHTCTGGFDPPPSRRKMYRVGGEKREKGKKMGKIRQKIGENSAKNRKRGENQQIWLKIGING